MTANAQDPLALLRDLLIETGYSQEAEKMGPGLTPKQVGLDSLTMLELLMLVDERTGIEITTDEVGLETTFGELAEMISRKA